MGKRSSTKLGLENTNFRPKWANLDQFRAKIGRFRPNLGSKSPKKPIFGLKIHILIRKGEKAQQNGGTQEKGHFRQNLGPKRPEKWV